MSTKLFQHIENLWDYMQLAQPLHKADCLFVLGSNDVRVAEHAAKLYHDGWANKIVFSGGVGRLTDGIFDQTEAHTFAAIARDLGVPSVDIILEDQATNTGENIQLTAKLLTELCYDFRSFILVQKPYMERRAYATFMKQWPNEVNHVCVTSPKTAFIDYFSEEISLDVTVEAMLDDFERIKEYPKKGFQIEQEIPLHIETSYLALRSVFN
ncbi:YdcF family protein [Vibrio coralliilyticus]|uniref:YdcF family protein n=1 Tax=Vibrio coralliilyticus TaxID=190893 RepID=UPI00240A4708|nr:YdcF family protein [Vibrio coralliilyticus]WFB49142.1 YdcF family protein [Vibrio coralliilyticus]